MGKTKEINKSFDTVMYTRYLNNHIKNKKATTGSFINDELIKDSISIKHMLSFLRFNL